MALGATTGFLMGVFFGFGCAIVFMKKFNQINGTKKEDNWF